MTFGKDDAPHSRRGYHHGNLRDALIKAALDLITEKGLSGFTFAEAARAAGVSPAAPYRHYRDRDALMADVACRGFEAFEAFLKSAWANATPTPFKALKNVSDAYLHFARRESAQFAAMFEAGLSFEIYPHVRDAGDRAFMVMRDACAAVVETMPHAKRPPVMMMALHVWSQAHGVAVLFGRGDGARHAIPMSPEDLLDASLLIYFAGLSVDKSKA